MFEFGGGDKLIVAVKMTLMLNIYLLCFFFSPEYNINCKYTNIKSSKNITLKLKFDISALIWLF